MKDEEEKIEQEEKEKKPDIDVDMIDTVSPQNKPAETTDEFKVIPCSPTPYIVCQYQDSQLLKEIKQEEGIVLSMSQLRCKYVTSRPTGTTNLAISEEYLNKYTSKRTAQSFQPAQGKSAATMLAEMNTKKSDEGEGAVVAGVYVNSQPLRVKKKAVLERLQAEACGPQGQGGDDAPKVIVDGDEQWNNVNEDMAKEEDGYK